MAEVRVKIPRLRLIKGRFYWWPTPAVQALGFASEALGADPIKAAERATALNAQVDGERRGVKEPSVEPETVAALIRLYRSDAAFTALRKTTQRGYGNVLDQIEAKEGKVAVRSITKKQLKAVYRELLTRGVAVAGLHMRIWRLLLSFAEDEGWIESAIIYLRKRIAFGTLRATGRHIGERPQRSNRGCGERPRRLGAERRSLHRSRHPDRGWASRARTSA